MALLFLSMFTMMYGEKYAQNYDAQIKRNQYVMGLLNENIIMRRKLNSLHFKISQNEKQDLSDKQKELKRELEINAQMQKNFDERSEAFFEGTKIIGISLCLSLFSILILGLLLQRWVIIPTKKLTEAADLVSKGDFSHRIEISKHPIVFDEFDTLSKTFNNMLENIENHIEQIHESELFLQSLIDAIPDGIRVIDHDYNIILSNKAYDKQFCQTEHTEKCYQAYGYEKPCPNGILSCPLKEISHAKAKSISLIQSVFDRPLSVNAAPLNVKTSDGENSFYIIESIRDLSDDIRFSHQQKIASLGFLATSVAHEMKNNLGSVRMIIEALLDLKDQKLSQDSQTYKYLTLIHEQLLSSIAIPERLLKLARNNIEEKEVFDIKSSIEDVVKLLDYEAKRNGVTVNCAFSKTETNILGNMADFKMMILNLAQNALKAMPSGGELLIQTAKDKNYVIVKIKDTGIGIPSEKLAHIFEPFYSGGQSSRHQGTGLGLAIVKSLVEKYKGSISASSIEGKGSVFEIKLPKCKK